MTTLNSLLPVRRVESQVEQLTPSGSDVALVLPSAANMLGKIWTIINSGSGSAVILVQSSSGTLLGVVNPGCSGQVTPLIDFPTLATHWQLVGTWKEYAYNTSITDADDTTSFANGLIGTTVVGPLTTGRNKRVRFKTSAQVTDQFTIEIQLGGSTAPWSVIGNGDANSAIAPIQQQGGSSGTQTYGLGFNLGNVVNGTDIDVYFGHYRFSNGGTYATAGAAWATSVGNWRVCKRIN